MMSLRYASQIMILHPKIHTMSVRSVPGPTGRGHIKVVTGRDQIKAITLPTRK